MRYRLQYAQFNKPVRGFTLVELLVVISIIALLLSILMPSLRKAREQAKKVICMSNLKQQGVASMMYCMDYGGALIPERSYATSDNPQDEDTIIWAALLAPYIQSKKGSKSLSQGGYWAEDEPEGVLKVFKCPSQKDRFQFTWYLRYGINLNHISQPFHPAGPKVLKNVSISRPSDRMHIADSMDNTPRYQKLSSYTQKLRDNIKSYFGYGYPAMDIWMSEEGRGLGSYVMLVGDRHNNGANILFLDGRADWLKYDQIMFKRGEDRAKRTRKIALWDHEDPSYYYTW